MCRDFSDKITLIICQTITTTCLIIILKKNTRKKGSLAELGSEYESRPEIFYKYS